MTNESTSRAYLWFDLEFTSLDIETAAILQLAMLITDVNLRRLDSDDGGLCIHVRPPPEAPVSPWVQEHLGELLSKCRGPTAVAPDAVESRVCDYVDKHLGPPAPEIDRRPVIAGNSVHMDLFLARRLLPRLIERCHYRILDVTSFKLQWEDWLQGDPFDKDDRDLVKQYFPGALLPAAAGTHDACYDVQASIAELAYYRSHFGRAADAR